MFSHHFAHGRLSSVLMDSDIVSDELGVLMRPESFGRISPATSGLPTFHPERPTLTDSQRPVRWSMTPVHFVRHPMGNIRGYMQ
jgi:hypothetical protein